MDPEYSPMANVFIHLGLSILDLAFSATAGVAAAATGAHVEGHAAVVKALQLGALGGVIKSGIINAAVLITMLSPNIFVNLLLGLVASTFGAAILTTLAITHYLLSDTSNALIIAAAAAGAPMMAGTVMLQATGPVASIQCIGWDALAGYTFARVAENHGLYFFPWLAQLGSANVSRATMSASTNLLRLLERFLEH